LSGGTYLFGQGGRNFNAFMGRDYEKKALRKGGEKKRRRQGRGANYVGSFLKKKGARLQEEQKPSSLLKKKT